MTQSDRSDALDRLHALVGQWTLEAGPPGGPPRPGEARASFQWLDGRRFLIQRWTVALPEAPDGIAIIGSGDEPERFRQHYFDSRGVHRIYEMSLDDGVWKLRRDAPDPFPQRYTGTFSDDGRTITGRWEKLEQPSSWDVDFELAYRRTA